jgi:predicted metalloprotease with PDZ domain
MSDGVRYRVSMRRPHSHLVEVEAQFPGGAERTLALPVWTPGSYLVREYARNLQELEAFDEAGRPVGIERLDKRSWRVRTDAPVTLRYRVYANELTVRTSHLDGSHALLNGATVFLYDEALRDLPHRVEISAPPGWHTFCALPEEDGALVAPDYDALVDSPIEVGPHDPLTFEVAGVPHQVVIWGEPKPDGARLAAELKRVVETEAALFGGLPQERYLFLLYVTEKGRGGLEHQASSVLLYPRAGLMNGRGWEDFLTLAAHEYFHLWNVKRIRPRAMVPFDYAKESYTTLLWAFEGVTAYYDNLIVRRAGLMSAQRYLTRLGETLTLLQSTPGRRVQSLAEASWAAWIKLYRQDENTVNSAVSYYLKGEVVAALLDLELRRATGDRRGLDDLMRLLWERYGDGRGVPEDGVEQAASELAGRDLSGFFDHAIRGTGELDDSVFAHVGLEARRRVKESVTDKGGGPPRGQAFAPRGRLGVNVRGNGNLSSVLAGSPAAEAGLYADDEVLALDGFKVDGAGLVSRCEDKRPGERVRVTVFRRDRLTELAITLGEKPAEAVYLSKVEQPTDAQKASFRAWLGAGFDEAG